MLRWRHSLRAGAARFTARHQTLPASRQLSFSATIYDKDYTTLGPIPTKPLCWLPTENANQKQEEFSAVIDPAASEPVSSTTHRRWLQFSSRSAMTQRLDTILHFVGASRNLTVADFKRILPQTKHIPGWRSEGGLLKVIPMRNAMTLEREDQWLLAFSTPYHAALYHSRLGWYHQNAKINTPRPPLDLVINRKHSKIDRPVLPPVPGTIDEHSGEDLWQRLQEYTIYSPRQPVIVTQHIAPFRRNILDNLWWHHQWTKPDAQGRTAYPVMVSLEPSQKRFNGAILWDFIKKDSEQRGLKWDVYDSKSGIERVFHVIYGHGDSISEKVAHDVDTGALGHATSYSDLPMDRNKWMVRFKIEDEARRFIRRWHHREWDPDSSKTLDGYVSPILKVDQLW